MVMKVEHKAAKGSVGVESFQERLRLHLPRQLYNGKQKYLTLQMADNPENPKLAEAKAKQIKSDYDTMPKDRIDRHLVQQSLNLRVWLLTLGYAVNLDEYSGLHEKSTLL